MSYFLILDVGTTNVKAHAFSSSGETLLELEERLRPSYPRPGWVEEDPADLINRIRRLIDTALEKLGKPLGIGLTNQRSSTVVWSRESGEPFYNVITWQDTRTSDIVEEFSSRFIVRIGRTLGRAFNLLSKAFPLLKETRRGAYLVTLAYVSFGTTHSSMHLRWLIDNVPEVERAVQHGEALFGTIDSWIAWNLTGRHVTDYTNASATGLFDSFTLKWSSNILNIVGVPRSILPSVVSNDAAIGEVKDFNIPLLAMIADQQASLYAAGVSKGVVKMTSGTGTFIDMNVGEKCMAGARGLYPLIALATGRRNLYLLEGNVLTSGSVLDWLIEVGLMRDYSEIREAFEKAEEGRIVFIPALSGLGTPYAKPDARGVILGITRGTRREDLIRGAVEGVAMRCAEIIQYLEETTGIGIREIVADGGLSRSDDFLQSVANYSSKRVLRPVHLNGSAYGAYMLSKNVYLGRDPVESWEAPVVEKSFTPGETKEGFKATWSRTLRKLV
ncbi:MAG: FGGY family carbohydrate kinase [Candidatus Methanosuratincola sp.]